MMAFYSVSEKTEERLLEMPESGMGYQIIRYRQSTLVIFNATLALSLEELRTKPFSEKDYNGLTGNPERKGQHTTESLDLLDDYHVAFSMFDRKLRGDIDGLNFSEQVIKPPSSAIPYRSVRSYYRYSAYSRDKRIERRNGNYLPGTYATTLSDMHFVPSGFAAVGRYALPNPASARFVFPILTSTRPDLMGSAKPNYGQAGGGVEVLFSRGARNMPGCSFPINVG